MARYSSLAALRGDLTSDNADVRGDAYGAVYEAGVQPSDVLGSDPPQEAVENLESENIIPVNTEGSQSPAAEQREKMLSVLETIAENTGGSA